MLVLCCAVLCCAARVLCRHFEVQIDADRNDPHSQQNVLILIRKQQKTTGSKNDAQVEIQNADLLVSVTQWLTASERQEEQFN